jgi:hypothetical protein
VRQRLPELANERVARGGGRVRVARPAMGEQPADLPQLGEEPLVLRDRRPEGAHDRLVDALKRHLVDVPVQVVRARAHLEGVPEWREPGERLQQAYEQRAFVDDARRRAQVKRGARRLMKLTLFDWRESSPRSCSGTSALGEK